MDLFKYESLHMSPAEVSGWTKEGDYSLVKYFKILIY